MLHSVNELLIACLLFDAGKKGFEDKWLPPFWSSDPNNSISEYCNKCVH